MIEFKRSFEFYSETFDEIMEAFESISEQCEQKYGKNYRLEDLSKEDYEIHAKYLKLVVGIIGVMELRWRYDENPTKPIH